jgi:nucleoside 2-deoxyribosyltransferase
MRNVYLSGSICTNPLSMEWRVDVGKKLLHHGIQPLDPCRGKKLDDLVLNGLDVPGVMAGGAFVARDLLDIRRSDVVLLHYWGDPGRQSIGTWFEFGYAVANQIPVVVSDPESLIVGHPFVHQNAAAIFAGSWAQDKALEYLTSLLT